MEHRWGHRRDLNRAVQLGTRSGLVARGRLTNVSISGAFIQSPLSAPLFSYVQIQFTAMHNGARTATVVEGQVVRRDSTGFGIEWCEFAPDAVRALVMVPPFRRSEPPRPCAQWEAVPRPRARNR